MSGTRLGIVGGLGPLAGAHFYRRLVELTTADTDSDHLSVVLISQPMIPSRRESLAGRGLSPVPAMQEVIRELESLGCDLIAVPSSTTHAFYQDLAAAAHVRILNLIDEVTTALRSAGMKRPAMVATRATGDASIYEPHFGGDVLPVYPPAAAQDRIEALIDDVKRGCDTVALSAKMSDLVTGAWASSADSILLACTETPLIAPTRSPVPVFNATDILVRAALRELRPDQA